MTVLGEAKSEPQAYYIVIVSGWFVFVFLPLLSHTQTKTYTNRYIHTQTHTRMHRERERERERDTHTHTHTHTHKEKPHKVIKSQTLFPRIPWVGSTKKLILRTP